MSAKEHPSQLQAQHYWHTTHSIAVPLWVLLSLKSLSYSDAVVTLARRACRIRPRHAARRPPHHTAPLVHASYTAQLTTDKKYYVETMFTS